MRGSTRTTGTARREMEKGTQCAGVKRVTEPHRGPTRRGGSPSPKLEITLADPHTTRCGGRSVQPTRHAGFIIPFFFLFQGQLACTRARALGNGTTSSIHASATASDKQRLSKWAYAMGSSIALQVDLRSTVAPVAKVGVAAVHVDTKTSDHSNTTTQTSPGIIKVASIFFLPKQLARKPVSAG